MHVASSRCAAIRMVFSWGWILDSHNSRCSCCLRTEGTQGNLEVDMVLGREQNRRREGVSVLNTRAAAYRELIAWKPDHRLISTNSMTMRKSLGNISNRLLIPTKAMIIRKLLVHSHSLCNLLCQAMAANVTGSSPAPISNPIQDDPI